MVIQVSTSGAAQPETMKTTTTTCRLLLSQTLSRTLTFYFPHPPTENTTKQLDISLCSNVALKFSLYISFLLFITYAFFGSLRTATANLSQAAFSLVFLLIFIQNCIKFGQFYFLLLTSFCVELEISNYAKFVMNNVS